MELELRILKIINPKVIWKNISIDVHDITDLDTLFNDINDFLQDDFQEPCILTKIIIKELDLEFQPKFRTNLVAKAEDAEVLMDLKAEMLENILQDTPKKHLNSKITEAKIEEESRPETTQPSNQNASITMDNDFLQFNFENIQEKHFDFKNLGLTQNQYKLVEKAIKMRFSEAEIYGVLEEKLTEGVSMQKITNILKELISI